MKTHLFKSLLAVVLLIAATVGGFAQSVLITNTPAAYGLPSYDFGPVTVSAFYGETEPVANSAISSSASFIGVNSGDGNANSINDTDGVAGGADQERLRLEIEAGYYLTNLTFQWTRANGPLTNDGVRISGFASDPGAVFAGGSAVSNVRYTNGMLAFNVAWTGGTQHTASFTNDHAASAGGTLEITVADSDQTGPVIAINNFSMAEVPPATPEILTQPVPATRYEQDGTNVFNVAAFGDGTLEYQWYKSPSTAIPGGTNTSLTLPNLALSDAGNYYVVVSNITLATSTTSDTVALTVNSWVAPSFVVNPISQSAYIHQTVNFVAEANGSPEWSFAYQWTKGGSPIAGATNATLTLNDVSTSDVGTYTCTANNGVGSPATSTGAGLTVLTPTPGTYAAAAIDTEAIVYHRFSDVATSSDVFNFGTMGAAGDGDLSGFYYSGSPFNDGPRPPEYPNFEAGNEGPAFDNFSVNGRIPPLGDLGNTATLSAWVYLNAPQTPNAGIVYHRQGVPGNGSGLYVKKSSTNDFDVLGYVWNNQRWNINTDTLALPHNRWAFVAVVIEPTQATLYLQNGTNMLTLVDAFNHQNANFSSDTMVGWDPQTGLTDRRFSGVIDEVTIHNRSLSSSEVFTLFAASSNYPPSFVTSPQGVTNYTGLPFSLSAGAQGTPPMSYQWYKDSGAVSGATNDTYSVDVAVIGDSGDYHVVVSNAIDSVTSAVATVSILAQPPLITGPPQSTTNWLGLNASFSVTAEGSVPLSYQWAKTGTGDLSGETNTTMNLTNLLSGDAGDYFVTVTNPEGSSNSPAATLTVMDPNLVDQMLYLTNDHPNLRSNFTGNLGTEFLMGDYDRTVTHLGFFDADGDGLIVAHSVGIYTVGDPAGTGTLLADVSVPAGTSAGYTNGYRWVALGSPLTLTNGQTYLLSASAVANVDAWPAEWLADFNEVFVGYTAATNRMLAYEGAVSWPKEPANRVGNFLGATYGAYNLLSAASATPEVTLIIEKVGTDVRLTWPVGTLQQAPSVNGTYTDVPAATSPYTAPAIGQQMFYRVEVN